MATALCAARIRHHRAAQAEAHQGRGLMLERQPSPDPAAVRQRKTRARRRQGMVSLRLDVHEHRLCGALIASGRLTEAQALERPQIERELAKLVDDWIRRWLENRHA